MWCYDIVEAVIHFLTMSRVIQPVSVDVFRVTTNIFALLLCAADVTVHRFLSSSTSKFYPCLIGISSTSCANMKLVTSHGFLLKLPFQEVPSVNYDLAMEDYWCV